MQRHGWTLLFHDCIIEQLQKLHHAAERARRSDPANAHANANVKLFRALSHLMLDVIPANPAADEHRQGNTLGPDHRHWRRGKIGRRFRLFFRYDTGSRIIIYAWVNDLSTLRAAGSRSDPYAVFEKMLSRGHPPDDWQALLHHSRENWQDDEALPPFSTGILQQGGAEQNQNGPTDSTQVGGLDRQAHQADMSD